MLNNRQTDLVAPLHPKLIRAGEIDIIQEELKALVVSGAINKP
jgi:hypothetical protein